MPRPRCGDSARPACADCTTGTRHRWRTSPRSAPGCSRQGGRRPSPAGRAARARFGERGEPRVRDRFARARRQSRRGRSRRAARRPADGAPRASAGGLGTIELFPSWYLSTYLREEGRVAALAGDTASALRAYRHYLALRPDPEAEVQPEVEGCVHSSPSCHARPSSRLPR